MEGMKGFVPIKGYEEMYVISKEGKLYSLRRGRFLKPFRNEKGYLVVELCKNGTRRSCKLHRLVAETFVANPKGHTEVNHKDGNKTNNCAKNLEWCSRSENIKHAYDLGLRKRVYATGSKRKLLDLIDTLNDDQISLLLSFCETNDLQAVRCVES